VGPTQYEDLNGVLAQLVAGARDVLGANFVGAYLVGSFALGDADEHSDVDFLVFTETEISDEQVAGLQTLHGALHGLPVGWAQHLEGSYVPRERFRTLDTSRAPFLFLDNGSRELAWDNHCNSAVMRWVVRRHGVPLAGPDPQSLVDPVAPDALRREAVATMQDYADWAHGLTEMSRRTQPHLVLTCCRVLATLALGEAVSKRAAADWAVAALDPTWRDPIERAQADRPDPWGRVHRTAEPPLAERTLAFVDYALEQTKGPVRGPSVQ
jgi:predicted nucleotidyltransferase